MIFYQLCHVCQKPTTHSIREEKTPHVICNNCHKRFKEENEVKEIV